MEFLFKVNVLLSYITTEITTTTTNNNNNNNMQHARTQHIRPAVIQVRAAHREFERSVIHSKP
jgi:hypothetical protein